MTSRDEPTPGAPQAGAPVDTSAPSGGGEDLASFDRAIHDLHSRIADLRVSVDGMSDPGSAGAQSAAPPPVAPPAAYQPPPAAPQPTYEPPPASYEPPHTSFDPPPTAYEPPPAAPPPTYEAPPAAYQPPPAAYEPPPAPPPAYAPQAHAPATEAAPAYGAPETYPADGEYAPAGYAREGSDTAGTFSRVDVGPFEDLLAMTAFEEQLSALPSMADVRVRRFGHGRAEIELETTGFVPVARELMRIAPDAQAAVAEDGTLTVQLYDERWTGGADDESAAGEEEAAAQENPEERDPERG